MPQIDAPKIVSEIDFFCFMKLKSSVGAHCNMKVFESHLLLAEGINRKFVISTFFSFVYHFFTKYALQRLFQTN